MPRIDPRDWLMLALYDAINRYNAGTLIIKGDLLAPTDGEEDEIIEEGLRQPDVGWHHPSGMVGRCLRRKQANLIGLARSNPVNAQVSIMGFIGTAIHRVASKMLADHPRVIDSEQHVEDPSVPVRGRYDIRVKDHDGVEAIGDWKGCYSLPTEPKEAHFEQGVMYAYMHGAPRVIIQYITRAAGAGKRFDMDWDKAQPLWERLMQEAHAVTRMTVEGKVAPRTPESADDCKQCQFLNTCQATETGDPSWQQAVVKAIPMVLAASPKGGN